MLETVSTWGLQKLERAWQVYVESLPALAAGAALSMALMASVLLLELWLLGLQRSSWSTIRSWSGTVRNDVFAAILKYSGLHTYVGMLMTFGVLYLVLRQLKPIVEPLNLSTSLSPMQAGLLYFLLADFTHYWFHRFSHHGRFHWAVHRFHHSARAMTVLNANREHPLGQPIGALWLLLPIALMPPSAHTGALLAAALLIQFHGFITHSNFLATWGWLGEYVLVSPAAHRMHHGREPRFHNSNYGGTLIVWDRLFGTWRSPRLEPTADIAIGLDDDKGETPPLRYVVQSYLAAMRSLLQTFSGRAQRHRRTV